MDIKQTAFSKLQIGPPMGIGEICRNGGFNAKNKSTGLISWVDSNGYRHKYSDWTDKHKGGGKPYDEIYLLDIEKISDLMRHDKKNRV